MIRGTHKWTSEVPIFRGKDGRNGEGGSDPPIEPKWPRKWLRVNGHGKWPRKKEKATEKATENGYG